MKTKSIGIWVCVNKNGNTCLFTSQPTKNIETGKWESKYPFVNSVAYNQLTDLAEKAKLTWESDPEYFEITYEYK